MKQNKEIRFVLLAFLMCLPGMLNAQDKLPEKAGIDKNSAPVYPSKAMQQLMRFIPVSDVMPERFAGTAENEITDVHGSLSAFWKKLMVLDRPLRIVHIGDSHVRGHLFPYVVRKSLEEDFGSEAVIDLPVTYRTSGIAQETGHPGVVYHILGVNGATCGSYSDAEHIRQIADLNPDLVIISFGTNEANGRNYDPALHREKMACLINELKRKCPNASYLLTTPPGAYMRNGRRAKVINPRTKRVAETEKDFAADNGLAVWDMYTIVGGEKQACRNWTSARMFQRDKIHFTAEGYTLQGLLLHAALIKAYNTYVASTQSN